MGFRALPIANCGNRQKAPTHNRSTNPKTMQYHAPLKALDGCGLPRGLSGGGIERIADHVQMLWMYAERPFGMELETGDR